MTRRSSAALALALLAGPGAVAGQEVVTGFVDRTVSAGGRQQRYQVYVPAEYPGAGRWPVILFLHGAGERGTDRLLPTAVGLAPAIRQNPRRFPAIVVFPQVPPDSQWVGAPAEVAMLALRRTLREFQVDSTRVYLTGLSMGGHGVWYLAYRYPEVFAAAVPICGWVTELPRFRGSVPVVPDADSAAALAALARRLARLPLWIFHGEMDPVVPVIASRAPAAALQPLSTVVRYTEYLGLGHDVWDAVYASDAFTRWLFAQRRPF
ncbi:MAG: alpha/beta hydrolase-fold protein [Gemmatimonadales bacterium]